MGDINVIDAYVGASIRKYRKELKLSQSELGKAVGVSFQQIQKYESGINRVAASRLVTLAQALGRKLISFFPPEYQDI